MAVSDAQKKSLAKYKQSNIKRVPLDVQISFYEEFKSAAESSGMAVNAYIKAAIQEKMDRERNGD